MMTNIDINAIDEAHAEVNAAKQNLTEAIAAWESAVGKIHPATLLIASAQRRLDRAHALLRSVRRGTDTPLT